jgi:glycosyltransferase involved in cell wall biosynthesis
MPAANVAGAFVAWLAGVRWRFCTQHQPADTVSRWLKPADAWLGACGVYSRVLVVSRSVAASFATHPAPYRRRIRVIPNALAPIAPREDRRSVRQRLGIAEDALLAVAIGRLSEEKNALGTVIAASRVPALHLALVGDGPQGAEIDDFVATCGLGQRIKRVGHRSRQEAIDILFAADAFVQLSHFEGRSLALLEALGAAKPIVASDIPAQREALTLSDGSVAGLLCDPTDADAMAEALGALAADGALRGRLARLAARLAAAQDPVQMGDAYAGLVPP